MYSKLPATPPNTPVNEKTTEPSQISCQPKFFFYKEMPAPGVLFTASAERPALSAIERKELEQELAGLDSSDDERQCKV